MDSDFAAVEDQSGTRSALDGGGFRGYIGDEGSRGSYSHVMYIVLSQFLTIATWKSTEICPASIAAR